MVDGGEAIVIGLMNIDAEHGPKSEIHPVYALAMHYHHIRPTGSGPSIRLAITPPGEFHRHDRPAGQGPNGR